MTIMTEQNETWVVPTYNGIQFTNYLISNLGRLVSQAVYSGKSKSQPIFGNYRLIQSANQNRGYIEVYPYALGKRYYLLLHRLVWSSFMGDINDKVVIDHRNNEKHDNRLSNLQLLTKKANTQKWHRIDKIKKTK
jgi:hypothetical protein